MAALWELPQAMSRTRFDLRASIRRGLSQDKRELCPNLPSSPSPEIISFWCFRNYRGVRNCWQWQVYPSWTPSHQLSKPWHVCHQNVQQLFWRHIERELSSDEVMIRCYYVKALNGHWFLHRTNKHDPPKNNWRKLPKNSITLRLFLHNEGGNSQYFKGSKE